MSKASPIADRTPTRGARWTAWAVGLYVVGLVVVWGLIHFGADRWWVPTLMMFGPKWVYALPLPVLLVWLALARASWRVWAVAGVGGVLLLFPIGGYCVPWRTLGGSQPGAIRLVTCNTGGDRCDAGRLAEFIAEVDPDVVCLQECGKNVVEIFDDRWNVVRAGNLLVAAKGQVEKIDELARDLPNRWPRVVGLLTRVTVEGQTFEVAALHLFSPRYGLAEMTSSTTGIAPWRRGVLLRQTEFRRSESDRVRRWLAKRPGPILIAGDFNTPVASTIYRDHWDKYHNAFSEAGFGFGHTVAIKEGGFRFSTRIDQILGSDGWEFEECWVGPDVGSDHWPVAGEGRRAEGEGRRAEGKSEGRRAEGGGGRGEGAET